MAAPTMPTTAIPINLQNLEYYPGNLDLQELPFGGFKDFGKELLKKKFKKAKKFKGKFKDFLDDDDDEDDEEEAPVEEVAVVNVTKNATKKAAPLEAFIPAEALKKAAAADEVIDPNLVIAEEVKK